MMFAVLLFANYISCVSAMMFVVLLFANYISCVSAMMFGVLLFAVVVHGSEYVSYIPGNLPLVITAPHGGSKNPSSFPERSIDTGKAFNELINNTLQKLKLGAAIAQ